MPLADPGYIATVSTGGAVDPDWGNAVRDRLLHHFASAASRDANITSPTEGMAAWLADVDQFLIYNGVAWRQPWNLPWGTIGTPASGTAFTNTFTNTEVDITGCSVAFTAVANRSYQAEFSGAATSTVSGDQVRISITNGANSHLVDRDCYPSVANGRVPLQMFAPILGLAAGAATYKMRGNRVSGSGTCQLVAFLTTLTITDTGPNGAAA